MSRPLRALFVDEGIGGHRTVHVALERELTGRDDVTAEFWHVPDPALLGRVLRAPVPGLARLDADLQPLRAQLVRSSWLARRLPRRLAAGDVDVVHVYTQNAALLSARTLARTPSVVTTDSTTALNAHRLPYRRPGVGTPAGVAVSAPFERRVLDAADRVVANSAWVARSLRETYGVADGRLVELPFGVSVPPPPAPSTLARRAGTGRPVIAFTGHQLQRKGGDRLLRLHQQHLRDVADLLLITGEPVPDLPGVRVVSDLVSGDPRLWELLAGADVFCFPSTIDQAPNAVLEAMAAGLPVVAHPVAAVAEMVLHGATGVLVPEDDADRGDRDLLAALRSLLADPARRSAMGAAGRRRVEARYDMARSADRLVDVLLDVASTTAVRRARPATPDRTAPS